MLKCSIIIATYHRPKELADCIESILQQTVLPDEIIVVDDGNLTERFYEQVCEEKGIHSIYYKKSQPGLTVSRNKGVELSSGDILFFLDDDVILLSDYIEQILAAYDNLTGGVGGVVYNIPPITLKNRIRHFLETLFLVSGYEEGRVLPSGFCVEYGVTGKPISEIKEVDFLSGCACSYRREVFDVFSFSEHYNYGAGEDKDFSYRVSKKYSLKVNPGAKLHHLKAPQMRPVPRLITRMFLIGRYLFFQDYLKAGWWSLFYYHYALFGYALIKMIYLILQPNKETLEQLKGVLMAYKDIFIGNTLNLNKN